MILPRPSAAPDASLQCAFSRSGNPRVPTVLVQSDLPGLDLVHRGKVRDVYAISADELLIVASDRLSAFDVVLPDPIPGKGEMLCQISNFWFGKTAHLMPNHLTGRAVADGMVPLRDQALRLVADDVTTIAEVMRTIYIL